MRLQDLDGLSKDQQFEVAAKNAGVPVAVLRNMYKVESDNGNNMGPSSAGAEGHFQQIPKTRKVLEQRDGRTYDPYNFQQGLYMASQLLRENMQHFGNVEDAVKAYNGGWDESNWNNPETKDYVRRVVGGDATPGPFTKPGDLRDQMYENQRALREGRQPAGTQASLTPNQKAAIANLATASIQNGDTPERTTDLTMAARGQPEKVIEAATPLSTEPVRPDYTAAKDTIQMQVDADKKRQEEIDNRGYLETWGAAIEQNAIGAMIMREISISMARDTDEARAVDPEWQKNYIANRPELIKGLSPRGIIEADGARNEYEYQTIKDDDVSYTKGQQILADTAHPLLWGLAGTVADPVSLAAGIATDGLFTAGRTAAIATQAARVSGERLATLPAKVAVGTGGNLVARGALTGAATNAELTAMTQLMGKETTIQDYMHAVAAGLGLGILGGAVAHGLSKVDIADLLKLQKKTHDDAAYEAFGDIAGARAAAEQAMGPELAAQARAQRIQRLQDDIDSTEQPIADSDKPFPTNQEGRQVMFGEGDNEPVIGQQKPTPADVGTMQMRYGYDTVTGEENLNARAGAYLDAEKFFREHPQVQPNLQKRVRDALNLRKYIGSQSTGSILRESDDPVANLLGVVIAEDAAGESGLRLNTAAIESRLFHAKYMNGVEHAMMENFYDYAAYHGIGKAQAAVNTFTTGELWQKYMVDVYEEVNARGRQSYTPSAHPSIIRAGNRLEIGLQIMGDDQRLHKTLGNEFIPESAIGYMPRQFNGAALRALSAGERQRVIAELEHQFIHDLGFDPEFAADLARKYLKRAEDRSIHASGAIPPAPRGLKEVAYLDLVDDYSAGKIDEGQFMARLEALRKGAAKHTGKRLDIDTSRQILRDDGTPMSLSSLYVNDVVELYRSYANRVAGDIALARKGILGDRDIDFMTSLLTDTKLGNPLELVPAWQQIVAEIYNRPVSRDAHQAAGKILRPLRQFTNLRMLGGTVYPQLAETANIMTHMGVVNTLGIVQKTPRLAGELKQLREGIIPTDSILESVDRIVGAPLGAEEWQFVLPRVFDDATGILDGYSMGTLNRIIAGGQLLHQKMSFMRMATSIQKRFTGEEIVAKSLRYMRAGIEDRALADMGFTKEMRAGLMAHIDEFAKFDERGYCVAFDASRLPDQWRDQYVTALYRGVNQIIQGNFPGETGKWMRTELTQTLFQLRRFPSVAIEKQMIRQFRQLGTARALGGIMMGMGVGSLIYMGRTQIAASMMPEAERKKFLEQRMSIGAIAGGATSYVSALGMAPDFLQLFSGAAHMVNDNYNLGIWNSRGVPAQGMGQLIPSLGTADDAYNLTQNPSMKGALGLMPFSNIPFILPFINSMKGKLNEEDK